jgi:hypothetical protein
MARAKDLAGLAALGFLGYKLSQQGKGEDSTSTRAARPESTETREEPRKDFGGSGDEMSNVRRDTSSGDEMSKYASSYTPKTRSIIPNTKPKPVDKETNATSVVPGGNEKRVEGNKPMPSLRKVEARAASISADAMKNASRAAARRANLSPIDQIPGQNRSGPTGGERVSGTELSRNLSNTAAALTPLTGGASKVATEFALGNRAAKAATAEKLSPAGQRLKNMEEIRNVAMPGRRDAVMNPLAHAGGPKMMEKIAAQEGRAIEAEARAAAAQAAREAKTLNPNAWLAGPKGMAENFRRGGAVKMTASRRGDGIASRGKTRGKIC